MHEGGSDLLELQRSNGLFCALETTEIHPSERFKGSALNVKTTQPRDPAHQHGQPPDPNLSFTR